MMTLFQNVTRGSLVCGSGMLAVAVGSAGVQLTRWGMFGFVLTGVPPWFFGIVAGVGGVMYFLGPMVYGSASFTPVAGSPGARDRMLFLYLRPFELDPGTLLQLFVGASVGILAYFNSLVSLGTAVVALPIFLNVSKEQGFRDAFAPFGDFVAFGRPGEKLQPVGASRLYLKDDWKKEVTRHMVRARLVVVRPGSSPSIRWEVSQVLKMVPPERILFYLRFRGWGKRPTRDYEAFRRCVRVHLGAELPERLGEARYLVFDASGRPRLIREASRPSELIRQVFSPSDTVVPNRLLPVLQAVGLEPPLQANTLVHRAARVFVRLGALFSITIVAGSLAVLLFVLALAFLVLLARLLHAAASFLLLLQLALGS
jgi:hypothetical protein